jgi:lipopolysaccharide/colanic/teichoic acid biosynthesis glycosyltransferase
MNKQAQLAIKRVLDITLSLVGVVLLAIPFALTALAIKLDSKGPVFFRQERVEKDGRLFKVWKFRTMVVGAVQQGLGYNAAKDDSRITRIGSVLRNWGLDELPQLINVFVGEMNLVGPRPTLRYQVEHYNDFQRRRLQVKPGITSLAVVSGRNALYGEDGVNDPFVEPPEEGGQAEGG